MEPRAHMAALAALIAVAGLLVWLPRRLFEEAGERRLGLRPQIALGVLVAAV